MYNDRMQNDAAYDKSVDPTPGSANLPLSELLGHLASTADQLDSLVANLRGNMTKLGFAVYDNSPVRIPNMEILHKRLADGTSTTEALSDVVFQVGLHTDAISGIANCLQQQLSDHQLGAKEAKQNAHR